MNKHSTVRFALSLLFVDLAMILLTLVLLGNLFGMVDSALYDWGITALLTFILYIFIWLNAAQTGKADVDLDAMNQKRFERNEAPEQKKAYRPYKGFVAGLLCKIPAVILLILSLATGNPLYEFFLNVYFGMHYSASIITFGTGLIPTLCYILLFAMVSGFAYMTGPAQREKLMTVIKRNESSYKKNNS